MKLAIDNMSYTDMFRHWRFDPPGSAWFVGDVGKYFTDKFKQKREEEGPEEHTRISKQIGW